MTDYSEDDVLQIVDELRQLGLVAVVHTESGRTERYRHYLRRRFTLTEPQVAILTELLLRGRQTVGDLRARASRMVAIENLDDLREALRGLISLNFVQSSGPLDRRGVEVDHAFYSPQESKKLVWNAAAESDTDELVETREARREWLLSARTWSLRHDLSRGMTGLRTCTGQSASYRMRIENSGHAWTAWKTKFAA